MSLGQTRRVVGTALSVALIEGDISPVCKMCGKKLPPKRRMYCSDKCANRAAWVKAYGLAPEDYRELLGDGRCVICGRKMKKVNVDHDHKTGLVRGLVCGSCNKRVLTVIFQPIQAFRLLQYLVDNPAKLLSGEPRVVGEAIIRRDKKPRRFKNV